MRFSVRFLMVIVAIFALLFTAYGWVRHTLLRDIVGYELDVTTFGATTMTELETVSGIVLPDGAKGLRFRYVPPIDPIYFAHIAVPMESKAAMIAKFETFDPYDFSIDFASESCRWWPPRSGTEVISKQFFHKGFYVQVHLYERDHELILYLKCFTI